MIKQTAISIVLIIGLTNSSIILAQNDKLDCAALEAKLDITNIPSNVSLLTDLLKCGRSGNVLSQYYAGLMSRGYSDQFEGMDRKKGLIVAAVMFSMAAQQGHADAQFQLGVLYHKGLGFEQDFGKALEWYRNAADNGSSKAMFALSVMYGQGEGVPVDQMKSFSFLRDAANQGLVETQFLVGLFYYEGSDGAIQNYVQAYMWWNIAASKNYADAIRSRGKLADQMTPSQIAEAQELSREWLQKRSGQ